MQERKHPAQKQVAHAEGKPVLKNGHQSKPAHSFFRLPLEKGTRILRLSSLNAHSAFRRLQKPYLPVTIRMMSFRREVLTIGVRIADECEERVLIRVRETELWINCTVDTDEHYLSRYAYFALHELLYLRKSYDFDKYYWPGFFDPKTGKSKYLNIINDRKGLDVYLKPKYPAFYKPGYPLPPVRMGSDTPGARKVVKRVKTMITDPNHSIGYILADTNMRSLHSPHYPFLIPFYGVCTPDLAKIKSFSAFITEGQQLPFLPFDESKLMLNEACYRMKELAPLEEGRHSDPGKLGEELFNLWQQQICTLAVQDHSYYYYTFGLKNVKGKPRSKWLKSCRFSIAVPELIIECLDKGDYFELVLKFKVKGRTFIPHQLNTTLFISSRQDPMTFYLLGSYNDCQLLEYFSKLGFKMGVLKADYGKIWGIGTLRELEYIRSVFGEGRGSGF